MENDKRLVSLERTIRDLKYNQNLIMRCLLSDVYNGLTEKDLKTVRWGYQQRFKMLQREKQRLTKKFN